MVQSMPDEELLDVCDDEDRVVGTMTRAEIHRRQLRHRAVHIWVFRPDGRILVQLRAATKDEFPLAYTSSASGHVDAGESYDEAATRELQEELGLCEPLVTLVTLPAGLQTAWEHTRLYRCTTDSPPHPAADEIADIEWLGLDELRSRMAQHPESFTPPFRELLAWYEAAGSTTGPSDAP